MSTEGMFQNYEIVLIEKMFGVEKVFLSNVVIESFVYDESHEHVNN